MKSSLFLLMFLILGLFLVSSCSQEKAEKTDMEVTADTSSAMYISADMLTYPEDVTCGMDLHKHAIADTAIYEGQLYGFCSEYCKNKFKEDPKAVLAQYESEKK
ncbi:MAG: YHS domain-containing protein [Calditrichia bacterium]